MMPFILPICKGILGPESEEIMRGPKWDNCNVKRKPKDWTEWPIGRETPWISGNLGAVWIWEFFVDFSIWCKLPNYPQN